LIARLLRSRAFVLTLIVLPGLYPIWPILGHNPTVLADPGKYVLHHLGFVACVLLATVLTFTPLVVLFPKSEIARTLNLHRTLVGVSAFVYGALHFTTHILYEGGLGILKSDIRKPFLLAGMTILTILLVLAATSPKAAVRALGGRRWKRIHRLAYVAAALAAYHQAAARKIFPRQVLWIFVPLGILELLRIGRRLLERRRLAAAATLAKESTDVPALR
jgi:methionine sulfoxide reductase heme-binding subunit